MEFVRFGAVVAWVATACVGVVLSGCTSASHHTARDATTAPASSAMTICRTQFPGTTHAVMTNLESAFHAGTASPSEVHGYRPTTAAAQCLVPTGSNWYDVDVIVVSDHAVLPAGSQSWGGGFLPRP